MINIRELTKADYHKLEEFLYWAIFTPKGAKPPARDIIRNPDTSIYIESFGCSSDCGVIAETGGQAIGAAWTRIIPAYGHIDDFTPELAISVLPEYRSNGVGSKLMHALFGLLLNRDCKQTSLAVQKANPAVNFYLRLGYEIVKEKPEEYLMLKKLSPPREKA